MRPGGEPQVGVVLPQRKPVLGPAGHHAVGLVGALGGQVVHHHADVGLIPGQDEGLALLHVQRGVDARQDALGGGLLIARGAVHLARQVQPRHLQRAQALAQGQAVDAVVFDGVGQAGQHAVLQAGNGAVHGPLHVLRQAAGHALHVPFLVVQPSGSRNSWCRSLSAKRTILLSMLGQYRGPVLVMAPLNMGARSRLSNMIWWVRGLV